MARTGRRRSELKHTQQPDSREQHRARGRAERVARLPFWSLLFPLSGAFDGKGTEGTGTPAQLLQPPKPWTDLWKPEPGQLLDPARDLGPEAGASLGE